MLPGMNHNDDDEEEENCFTDVEEIYERRRVASLLASSILQKYNTIT